MNVIFMFFEVETSPCFHPLACRRHAPAVPYPWPLANSSLSEGEVPLSPGDARWHALYAAKMKDVVIGRDSTLNAFLGLKHSPEPLFSDSSQLSADPKHVRMHVRMHVQCVDCVCVESLRLCLFTRTNCLLFYILNNTSKLFAFQSPF